MGKETDEKTASDIKEYEDSLKEGDFLSSTESVSMEDYLKVHLEVDEEKREAMIAKHVSQAQTELEKKAEQKVSDFKKEALDQKNQAIQDGKQKIRETAKQNIKGRLANAEQKK